MQHRLSPRESRRLVRRFLRQDERAPGVTILFASGLRKPAEPVPAGSPPPPPPAGNSPYELQYPVSNGYLSERTIIVP